MDLIFWCKLDILIVLHYIDLIFLNTKRKVIGDFTLNFSLVEDYVDMV